MSSWVSHFRTPPARLTVLGMNSEDSTRTLWQGLTVVHDLSAEPRSPFPDESFDAVVCCVSSTPHQTHRGVYRRGPCCAQEGRSSVRSQTDAFRPRLFVAGCMPTTNSDGDRRTVLPSFWTLGCASQPTMYPCLASRRPVARGVGSPTAGGASDEPRPPAEVDADR